MEFIPRKIHIGCQYRSDTYTGKLAYVVYTDHKSIRRKEYSWYGWRDPSIPIEDFNNEPTTGFILNKRAGGKTGSWSGRKTTCRVLDPRGFEVEISIDNLLYILEHASCVKGKGLGGDFVYAWDGAEMLLMPTNTPDHKASLKFSNDLYNGEKIGAKDLKIGYLYDTRTDTKMTYLGRENKGFLFQYSHNDSTVLYNSVSNKFILEHPDPDADAGRKAIQHKIRKGVLLEDDGVIFEYSPYTFEEFKLNLKGYIRYVSLGSQVENSTSITAAESYQLDFNTGDLICRDIKAYGSFVKVEDFIEKESPQKLTVSYQGNEIFKIGE